MYPLWDEPRAKNFLLFSPLFLLFFLFFLFSPSSSAIPPTIFNQRREKGHNNIMKVIMYEREDTDWS